jgi:hypothetical protein
LGIAGNFALHLDQAGEAEDFKDVITADEAAPKGIFPFYLKDFDGQLGTYPLSSDTIILPDDSSLNIQAEPEVALICDMVHDRENVISLTPKYFAPYNDCSIRRQGAKKISEKKNWGEASKGIGEKMIEIDTFDAGGIMDSWHIASFLRRDGVLHRYGEDAAMITYSYFHKKLTDWIVNQLNSQEDTGPHEAIHRYLRNLERVEQVVISIGATRYTPYGETTFLKAGDDIITAVYDSNSFDEETVMQNIDSQIYDAENMSVLLQRCKQKPCGGGELWYT